MKDTTNHIYILCVCDNHYVPLLAALIRSITRNHLTEEPIEIIAVNDHITKMNRDKISRCVDGDKIKLTWIDIAHCIPKSTKLPTDKSSLPLNIYVRLLIQEFIPQDITRLIYMDVDMLVLEDISKLWNIDLHTNIIGAVQDPFVQSVGRWGGVANYADFGLTVDSPYFNAGLLLIDMKKWRENSISDKVLDCLQTNQQHALYQDQYGLNAILGNQWYMLDAKWNRFAYSEDNQPFLIHFTGRKPIYLTYNYRQDYKDLFFEYLEQTPWKGYKQIGETTRYLKKARNILQKLQNKLRLLRS